MRRTLLALVLASAALAVPAFAGGLGALLRAASHGADDAARLGVKAGAHADDAARAGARGVGHVDDGAKGIAHVDDGAGVNAAHVDEAAHGEGVHGAAEEPDVLGTALDVGGAVAEVAGSDEPTQNAAPQTKTATTAATERSRETAKHQRRVRLLDELQVFAASDPALNEQVARIRSKEDRRHLRRLAALRGPR